MNNELIERINKYAEIWHNYSLAELLQDCKSEIQRLLRVNETLKEISVEYLERVKTLESELQKAREYVPMTDDEWETLYKTYEQLIYDPSPSPKYIEAEVVRRMKEQGLI